MWPSCEDWLRAVPLLNIVISFSQQWPIINSQTHAWHECCIHANICPSMEFFDFLWQSYGRLWDATGSCGSSKTLYKSQSWSCHSWQGVSVCRHISHRSALTAYRTGLLSLWYNMAQSVQIKTIFDVSTARHIHVGKYDNVQSDRQAKVIAKGPWKGKMIDCCSICQASRSHLIVLERRRKTKFRKTSRLCFLGVAISVAPRLQSA